MSKKRNLYDFFSTKVSQFYKYPSASELISEPRATGTSTAADEAKKEDDRVSLGTQYNDRHTPALRDGTEDCSIGSRTPIPPCTPKHTMRASHVKQQIKNSIVKLRLMKEHYASVPSKLQTKVKSQSSLTKTKKSESSEADDHLGDSRVSLQKRPDNSEETEPLPEDTPEDAPEPTPEEAPEPTPEDAPELTPEDAPEPTPEDAPEPTPEPTPEDAPEPTPEDAPQPTPDDAPEPTPEDAPEPTPEDAPEPTPEDAPEPTPEDAPEPTPKDAPEPTPEDAPEEVAVAAAEDSQSPKETTAV